MNPGAATEPANCIAALLTLAAQRLSHLQNGRLDAEYLLAHALDKTRTWLHTWPEKIVDAGQANQFEKLVHHRAIGMPVAYLTGRREFWSLPLQISTDTLVPRAETERLVELAVQHADDAAVIVDLGTGSGAIALAVASELPGRSVIATDLSASALTVAKSNASALNHSVQFVQSDWLTAFSRGFADMIVSNPPYIPVGDPHLSGDGVLFEPAIALIAGPDGLAAYRQIVPQAAHALRRPGTLLVEHGYNQGDAVRELMSDAGFINAKTYRDHAGLDRVTAARLE